MYGLLRFILKYGAVLLFILFELIAFYLVVNYNQGQKTIFIYSANRFSGRIYDKYDEMISYLKLTEIADSLAGENARLKQQLSARQYLPEKTETDSAAIFEYIPARIVSNSVTNRNNMIMLDIGAENGVRNGLGVVGATGPIGVVRFTGMHYTAVLSILHSQSMLSARIKDSGHFGSLVWESNNPRLMELQAIPKYASVSQGDTVETSGYSFIFPEGLPIGEVTNYRVPSGSNFYEISVRLFYDMSSLHRAYVLEHRSNAELDSLSRLIYEQE